LEVHSAPSRACANETCDVHVGGRPGQQARAKYAGNGAGRIPPVHPVYGQGPSSGADQHPNGRCPVGLPEFGDLARSSNAALQTGYISSLLVDLELILDILNTVHRANCVEQGVDFVRQNRTAQSYRAPLSGNPDCAWMGNNAAHLRPHASFEYLIANIFTA
jgi:hypothetical protein